MGTGFVRKTERDEEKFQIMPKNTLGLGQKNRQQFTRFNLP
jgi:hypothetical protein